ncbi:TlpA family protein disulfide reductase [Paenibacillus sp. FA6]|uniref:TlpA family protein disulfide reductase n=1 Tax=Paenibacillus sp. FA6 TaxID=3413029 RepID=UPI003F65ACB2
MSIFYGIKRHSSMLLALLLCTVILLTGCSKGGNTAEEKRIAPALQLVGINKEKLDTSTITKPVLYTFWASWCQYCNKEVPVLDDLYAEYKDQVEFVSVNVTTQDTLKDAKEFVEKHDLQMPVYLDVDGIAGDSLKVYNVPTVILVDADGVIVEQKLGASGELAAEEYRLKLDQMLVDAK